MDEKDLESRLRASLRRNAQDAPPSDLVAERVLRSVERGPRVSRRGTWRSWTLPLAAAAAMVVVAGIGVGVTHLGNSPAPAATHLAGTTSPTRPTATATTGAAEVPAPSPVPTTAQPQSSRTQPVVPADLHDVHLLDATFVGPADGWLLARTDCLDGPGACTAMLRTTDGGAHWTAMPPPPANVPGVNGCAAPCVDHIRFANDETGYAFGGPASNSTVYFMTIDAGAHWREYKGVNIVALESVDDNVIRVTTTDPACGPPGCTYQVQTAAIGSAGWGKPHVLNADPGMSTGAQLVRGGDHNAYVLIPGHPAGGGSRAFSTLYRSADDGHHWTVSSVNRGEPCPQNDGPDGEVDAGMIAAGGGDRVAVVCTTRQAPQHSFVAVSTDGGAHFTRTTRAPWPATRFLTGDPATVLLAAGGAHVYRSTDGGRSWARVATGLTGDVSWAGFESTTAGRIIGDGGRQLWTTHDGGANWSPLTFG